MPPATANARVPDAPSLLQAYVACATARGRANKSFLQGARAFLARWPEPQEWADEPLEVRLAAGSSQWPLLNFLMFWGHLQPGYDYLVERKLSALWREMPLGPWREELRRYQAAAQALGYGPRTCAGTASQIAARLLIQTGRPLIELTEQDFAEFEQAIAERERRYGRSFKHYRNGALRRPHGDLPPGQRSRAIGEGPPSGGDGVGSAIWRVCQNRCAFRSCATWSAASALTGGRPSRIWPRGWRTSAVCWPGSIRTSLRWQSWTGSGTSSHSCMTWLRLATASPELRSRPPNDATASS